METLKNILTFPVKILIFLFGLVMLYWGSAGLRANTSEWLSIEAQVISAVDTSDSDSAVTKYKITYEYQVGAEKYTGFYTYYNALPAGEKLTVYYDPADPETSTYSREDMKKDSFWGLLFGLGCVIWVTRDAIMAIWGKPAKPMDAD